MHQNASIFGVQEGLLRTKERRLSPRHVRNLVGAVGVVRGRGIGGSWHCLLKRTYGEPTANLLWTYSGKSNTRATPSQGNNCSGGEVGVSPIFSFPSLLKTLFPMIGDKFVSLQNDKSYSAYSSYSTYRYYNKLTNKNLPLCLAVNSKSSSDRSPGATHTTTKKRRLSTR